MSAPNQAVIGLGNPDERHAGTRHNIGWMVVDVLAKGLDWKSDRKLSADIAQTSRTLIAKPTTYMNESGTSVGAIRRYYKLDPAAILVVSDDINLPFGELRYRESGGAGGQKGLKDIIRHLDTEEFPRLRVGIGEPSGQDATPHVLGRFSKVEQQQLPDVISAACARIEEWLHPEEAESPDG